MADTNTTAKKKGAKKATGNGGKQTEARQTDTRKVEAKQTDTRKVEAKKADTRRKDAPAISHEDIADRAHQLWLARGGHGGDALQDWLTAERQLQDERSPRS